MKITMHPASAISGKSPRYIASDSVLTGGSSADRGRGTVRAWATPAPHSRCVCGKLSLPSEQAAKDVVFEARIARAVHHNHRRQENRYYQCPYGAWHTTRQVRLLLTTAVQALSPTGADAQDRRTNSTASRNVTTPT